MEKFVKLITDMANKGEMRNLKALLGLKQDLLSDMDKTLDEYRAENRTPPDDVLERATELRTQHRLVSRIIRVAEEAKTPIRGRSL